MLFSFYRSGRDLIGLDRYGLDFSDFSIVKSILIKKFVRICQQFSSVIFGDNIFKAKAGLITLHS